MPFRDLSQSGKPFYLIIWGRKWTFTLQMNRQTLLSYSLPILLIWLVCLTLFTSGPTLNIGGGLAHYFKTRADIDQNY